MDFSKYNIGIGITGSFCMFARTRKEIQKLVELGANVIGYSLEPKNDAIDAKILIISLLSDYKLYGYCILSLKAYN